MIHYIPIENIEQRYTKLMNDIVYPYVDYIYYPMWDDTQGISKGEFLDIEKTIEFKSKQITLISQAFQMGKVKDGDWFIFGDIYFQGIESIKYMAELQDIKVYIAGFNYAGRADVNDFVNKLGRWSDVVEKGYHSVADIIFVGSHYHKENVITYFHLNEDKVKVTGYVWDNNKAFEVYPYMHEKEDYIIYPHRLAKEKGIQEFINIAEMMPNKTFVVTSSSKLKSQIALPTNVIYRYGLTKAEYYDCMSKAKYYLSTAHQETFGYTLREALLYNCIVAAPNRACYKEMLNPLSLYNNINEIEKIYNTTDILTNKEYRNMYSNNIEKIISYARQK